jgi:hypothetical protein
VSQELSLPVCNPVRSVSILIVFTILGVAASQVGMCLPEPVYTCDSHDSFGDVHELATCTPQARLFLVKLMCMAGVFFLVFFYFTQMMRLITNCMYAYYSYWRWF